MYYFYQEYYFLFASVCALTALGVLYVMRDHITTALYFIGKYWRQSLFIAICIGVGTFAGLSMGNGIKMQKALSDYLHVASLDRLLMSGNERTLYDINNCKNFVTAQMVNNGSLELISPAAGQIQTLPDVKNPDQYWADCARTFGMNYWKYDITIRGENGGNLLCDAYFRSDAGKTPDKHVVSWCQTVFAPAAPTSELGNLNAPETPAGGSHPASAIKTPSKDHADESWAL